MFFYAILGLGIGLFLAGMMLFITSYAYQKRVRNPPLLRWAGVVGMMMGVITGLIALIGY